MVKTAAMEVLPIMQANFFVTCSMNLKDKKILLGVTGSIAAYKTAHLVRLLIKSGAEVRVIMTKAATDFVSPLVLSVLSKQKVLIEWQENHEWNNHVELGRWADVFLIAPLSCNTLSKLASGACDNLLLAVYLSATCPVLVAPAMDEDMWKHPTAKKNLLAIKENGVHCMDVNKGDLASGLIGEGRMAEPEEIIAFLGEHFFRNSTLKGKKVLVTAGPTYEAIDPVRFIGNRSSGKMGFAIAEAFYSEGASVVLVTGPTHEQLSCKGIQLIKTESAAQMFEASTQFGDADIVVMSAAVADYTPVRAADQKIKKKDGEWNLELTKTKDILKYFGDHKRAGQFLAGFALETEKELEHAQKKLEQKHADCIFLNSLNDAGAGFEKTTNKITIISRDKILSLGLQSKKQTAEGIVQYIISQIS